MAGEMWHIGLYQCSLILWAGSQSGGRWTANGPASGLTRIMLGEHNPGPGRALLTILVNNAR
jgi:hypothetical protein